METAIAAGEHVKVMATEGLVLLVEPLHEEKEKASAEEAGGREVRRPKA
jgi:hypothetical protein